MKASTNSLQADMSKASTKVQDSIPGRTTQTRKEGEKWASEAGAKVDSAVSASQLPLCTLLLSSANFNETETALFEFPPTSMRVLANSTLPQTDKARAELAKAEGKFDQYRKDAASSTMKKIDEADRKVEEGAAKTKSGISSWFGGK